MSIALKRRKRIVERDGFACAYCNVALSYQMRPATVGPWDELPAGIWPSVDHDVPRSRGGSDADANLVACCTGCNSQKGSRTGDEYRAWRLERGL